MNGNNETFSRDGVLGSPGKACVVPPSGGIMQLRRTIPLTSILSPKGRGSKPPHENESLFGGRNEQCANGISSPLGGEGRVRDIFDCIVTPSGGIFASPVRAFRLKAVLRTGCPVDDLSSTGRQPVIV